MPDLPAASALDAMRDPALHLAPTRPGAPGWDEVWEDYGSGSWLAAKALIEISPALLRDAAQWTAYAPISGHRDDQGVFRPDPIFEAEQWIASVESQGRGWSSTEQHLFEVIASLLDPERSMRLVGFLDSMGSWEAEVWRILVNWGTGGDNREHPGRARVETNPLAAQGRSAT